MKTNLPDTKLIEKRSDLESLVDELIKSSPNEAVISAKMRAAGLTYSKDPIERMSLVLMEIEGAKDLQANETKPQKRRERDHVQDL